MNITELKAFKVGVIPDVLFIGNGINKAFNEPSWGKLISDVTVTKYKDKLDKIKTQPYPIQAVIATDDNVDKASYEISSKLNNKTIDCKQKRLLSEYMKLPFENIITTNYTYEIEKTIDDNFYCNIKTRSKYRKTAKEGRNYEEQFGLYKFMEVGTGESAKEIWHIHGETARPKSIILGHYYYGTLLSYIQQYVAQTIGIYKADMAKAVDYMPHSWIDYFMFGNVYIVGSGLDFSEMDLWWLINCKKRNGVGKVHYFEPDISEEKNMLANIYGVDVHTLQVEQDSYIDYYYKTAKQISNMI